VLTEEQGKSSPMAAYFITYAPAPGFLDFKILLDNLGAYQVLPNSWILKTDISQDEIWKKFLPFQGVGSGLFMVQVFPGSLAYWIPQPFTRDPVKEFLKGLSPYIG